MSTKKSIKFIVNPISGTHKKEDMPKLIEEHIDTSIFCPEVVFTEYAGHAADLAHQYASEGLKW